MFSKPTIIASGLSLPVEIPVTDENDVVRITPLGAGNEVGRSCHLLQYKGKNILLDAGLHPAYAGLAGLPFLDDVDLGTVDMCLVSHFHLDHAAALPYLMTKTDFRGKVYATHPTKAIFKWLLSDYVRVSNAATTETMLYNEVDLAESHDKIQAVDYHERVTFRGIHVTAFNAGHVLGAAMFLVEIAGVRILYTGDYSREEDRHLCAAEMVPGRIDVLICESTYGVQSHEPREARESRFTSLVHDVVRRGGRCLVPVFALGRAQELLLILDEYWSRHPSLHPIPIYFASSLAKKCMAVFQTFVNMMNTSIRKEAATRNPFVFRWIANLRNMDKFEDAGPCVMLASPGMLQSGLSRELFERWCVDRRNGVVITGYSVDGTLAKHILTEPSEVPAQAGGRLPLRCSVEYISFSAHVDFTQNSSFIEQVTPAHLVLVHGEANAMARLRAAMESRFKDKSSTCKIHTPRNCETVQLYFRGNKLAKTIGRLAAKVPEEGALLHGVLCVRDFQFQVVAPADLTDVTGLPVAKVQQRLRVPYSGSWGLIRWHLLQMYGTLEDLTPNDEEVEQQADAEVDTEVVAEIDAEVVAEVVAEVDADATKEGSIDGENVEIKEEVKDETMTDASADEKVPEPSQSTALIREPLWHIVKVFDMVTVHHRRNGKEIILEWDASPVADMIADSCIAVVTGIESCPASVKLTTGASCGGHDHGNDEDTDMDAVVDLFNDTSKTPAQALEPFLVGHYGGDVRVVNEDTLVVASNGHEAYIDARSFSVRCEQQAIQARISKIVKRAALTLDSVIPIPSIL